MKKYKLVAKKGEGTFSEVLKAQNLKDGKFRAIKCMKSHFENIDEVNNLREIQALRRLSAHPNIVSLDEVLYDKPTGRLALVFELMDANLYELIRDRKQPLNEIVVKSYMAQLFQALKHMHGKGIFHRDIKPENILIERSGKNLKLADLGSCRGTHSKQPFTEYISTRWYRAPECLLTNGFYGPEMDIWGAGCVFFEIIALYPLFPGSDELDQINRIHKVLGSPSPDVLFNFNLKEENNCNFNFPHQNGVGISNLIPFAGSKCIELISKTIKYDLHERISAKETLMHSYFGERESVLNTAGAKKITTSINQRKLSKPKKSKTVNNQNKNMKSNSKKAKSKSSLPQLERHGDQKCSDGEWNEKKMSNLRRQSMEIVQEMEPGINKNLRKIGKITQKKGRPEKLPKLQSSKQKSAKQQNCLQKPTHRRRKNKLYAHISSTGYGTSHKTNQSQIKKSQSNSSIANVIKEHKSKTDSDSNRCNSLARKSSHRKALSHSLRRKG